MLRAACALNTYDVLMTCFTPLRLSVSTDFRMRLPCPPGGMELDKGKVKRVGLFFDGFALA